MNQILRHVSKVDGLQVVRILRRVQYIRSHLIDRTKKEEWRESLAQYGDVLRL